LEVDQDAHAWGSVAQRAACELSRDFAEACQTAGFQYRGYGIEGGDREYAYSRPSAPDLVYTMRISGWDRTAGSLAQNAAGQEMAR
jgi:hypothetical protein